MKTRKWIVTVLAGLVMSVSASAATYFVAQEDTKAVDSNAGMAEAPFKTIAQALKVLKPGDTLWIKKGTYREPIVLTKEGRQGPPPENKVAHPAMDGLRELWNRSSK